MAEPLKEQTARPQEEMAGTGGTRHLGAALLPPGCPPSAQEREQRGRGALPGRERCPGFGQLETPSCWQPCTSCSDISCFPLRSRAPEHAAVASPSAEPPVPADVTLFPLPARLGLRWPGAPGGRDQPPPAPRACLRLSSSARLVMGSRGPSPPPRHCQRSFQHLAMHPRGTRPRPLKRGTRTGPVSMCAERLVNRMLEP